MVPVVIFATRPVAAQIRRYLNCAAARASVPEVKNACLGGYTARYLNCKLSRGSVPGVITKLPLVPAVIVRSKIGTPGVHTRASLLQAPVSSSRL